MRTVTKSANRRMSIGRRRRSAKRRKEVRAVVARGAGAEIRVGTGDDTEVAVVADKSMMLSLNKEGIRMRTKSSGGSKVECISWNVIRNSDCRSGNQSL